MALMSLGRWRRLTQIIFFLLIVYTSLFFVGKIDVPGLPFVNVPKDVERPEWYAPSQGYSEVFSTYLPIKTCRFIADPNRAFRSDFIHFANESVIWKSPPEEWLPHLALFLFLVFLFARAWCGWVCPLGAIQDAMYWIRKKLRLPKKSLSEKARRFLSKFRYGLLSVLFLASVVTILPLGLDSLRGELSIVVCEVCPARNIFPLFSGVVPSGFSFSTPIYAIAGFFGIAFLLLFASSFFVRRPWCRICPSGALIGFFNPISLLKKDKKKVEKCTSCNICERVCPLDNQIIRKKDGADVNTANCIKCFRCVENCPEKDCLKVKFAGKTIYKSRYKEK